MKSTMSKLVILVLLIGLASFKLGTSKKETLKVAPVYNKGTFWKITLEQTNTSNITGQVSVHATDHSCYINRQAVFKGVEVYEMTFIKNDEAAMTGYIDRSNLSLLGFTGHRKNYNDTLTLDHELLSLPLYKGKKWESMSISQEFWGKTVTKTFIKYSVNSVTDTTFIVDSETVKTRAYHIRADFTIEDDKCYSEYVYLTPNKKFPGSCPMFLYFQFRKNFMKIPNRENVKYDYFTIYKQTITNYSW